MCDLVEAIRFPAADGSAEAVLDVREVREYVREVLADDARRLDLRDVALMAGEIATNAYRYSASGKPGGGLRVAVFRNGEHARLEFTDDGGAVTVPRTPYAVGVSERGLMIVAGLSDAWGYWRADRWRGEITVWFECVFR